MWEMLLTGLRTRTVSSTAWKRLCSTVADTTVGREPKPDAPEVSTQPRLWAMERVDKSKGDLSKHVKAWRFPACIDPAIDWLPEGVGRLVYLDKLQVHQQFWKLGEVAFICTPFLLDIFERTWDKQYEKSRVVASLEVYPHLMNKKGDEIINLTLVSPRHWGKRCCLHYFGEENCIGIKKGGILKKILTYIALDCDVKVPVANINVDVSNLDIGEEISIQDLNIEINVTSNLKPETIICKVLPQ
ncbi:hypothetical protein KP509_12G017500 [Ceratopteris richardii]|uniref:Large ribosomal subunit protein bL25 beta domain-containing protein n=1 Tax=Ceratopteris richardii TaxID=49495 RepID=A0A8T2TPY3_CERRI|nr:hypothetical protein KP509_12G017500 [Ceratopteris richardii]